MHLIWYLSYTRSLILKLIMKTATTFASICCVPGTNLEASHRIIPNLHHKVGDVVLILLINKTKQKPRLSKFTKLAQGHIR